MSRGTGLAFSCASSLCILPWSDGVVEPDIYKLPESSLGGIAATPDLVFVPTADSAIHFLEPSKHTGISELIRVGASTTSGTKISALLYRSSDGTLVFARGSKVYRQHIESNQLRSSFDDPGGVIKCIALNRSQSLLATASVSPSKAPSLHTNTIDKNRWTQLRLPASVFSPAVSLQFSSKSRSTLFALFENTLLVYDTSKPNGPQRSVSLSTFTCQHMTLVPGFPAVAVVAAEGGKLLLMDVDSKAMVVSIQSLNVAITSLAFAPDAVLTLLIGTNQGEIMSLPYEILLGGANPAPETLWQLPSSESILSILPITYNAPEKPKKAPPITIFSPASSVHSVTTSLSIKESIHGVEVQAVQTKTVHIPKAAGSPGGKKHVQQVFDVVAEALGEGSNIPGDNGSTSFDRVFRNETYMSGGGSGTDARVAGSPSAKNFESPVKFLRTARFVQDQQTDPYPSPHSKGVHPSNSNSSNLLSVSQKSVDRDDDHSPVGAVLRRRQEREHRLSRDGFSGLELPPGHRKAPSSSSAIAQTERERASARRTQKALEVVNQITGDMRILGSRLDNADPHIPTDLPTVQEGSSRLSTTPQRSPHRPRSVIPNASTIRSSSPVSYTPKGTPPRVARNSLHSRTTEVPASSATQEIPPPLKAPKNNSSKSTSNSLALISRPNSPTAVILSPRAASHNKHSASSSLHENTHNRSHSSRPGLLSQKESRRLPASPIRAAITSGVETVDAGGHPRRPSSAAGRSKPLLQSQSRKGRSVPKASTGRKSAVPGPNENTGPARPRSHQQQQRGTTGGMSMDVPEPTVLEVVEELREETREAIVGLHIDLVKTGRVWKNEMRTLMEMHIGGHLRSLQKENARLRLENAALRGY